MRTLRILALVASLAPMSAALAADLLVPSTQYPTIQSAIDAAVSGDRVLVGPGSYNERVDLKGKAITLKGSNGYTQTILDPIGGTGYLLNASTSETLSTIVDGFTFRNSPTGGVRVVSAAITVQNCRFLSNTAAQGPAMWLQAANVKVDNTQFVSNVASDRGGAIYAKAASTVTLTNCTFNANKSTGTRGGAIYAEGSALTATGTSFVGNREEAGDESYGGAIYLSGCTGSLTTCSFDGNYASSSLKSYGGSIYLDNASPTIQSCTFVNCLATTERGGNSGNPDSEAHGGSAYLVSSSNPVFQNCNWTGARASSSGRPSGNVGSCSSNDTSTGTRSRGGAIHARDNCNAQFLSCTFTNAAAATSGLGTTFASNCGYVYRHYVNCLSYGGAIYAKRNSIRIEDCTFTGCQATDTATGQVNGADSHGGALWCEDLASPSILRTKFQSCSTRYGGAMFLTGQAAPFLSDCSFLNNTGSTQGGVVYSQHSSPNFAKTLFQGNNSPAGSVAYSTSTSSLYPAVGTSVFCGNQGTDMVGGWYQDPGNTQLENCPEDCNGNGINDRWEITVGLVEDCNLNNTPDTCDISAQPAIDCDGDGRIDACEITSGVGDCDDDGVLDNCEDDCNGDGVADVCQIRSGALLDCDRNGIPDVCDIGSGRASDCDGNGVPDSCQPDCDGDGTPNACEADCDADGTPDACEISAGAADCDGDGVPDVCQFAAGDANRDGVLDACQTVDFVRLVTEIVPIPSGTLPSGSVCYRVWAELANANSRLIGFYGSPGKPMSISAAGGFYQSPLGADTSDGVSCGASGSERFDSWLTIAQTCNSAPSTHPLYVEGIDFTAFNAGGAVQTSNGIVFVEPDAPQAIAGASRRVLLMQLTTLQAVQATGTMNLLGANADGSDWEAFQISIPSPSLVDCNANGIHDALDIAAGTSADCDRNGVPDECGTFADCNENGTLDACDIADGTSGDANANGVPDECECLGDVDGNGDVDVMDLVEVLLAWGDPAGSPADVDGNGSVDTGDLALVLIAFGGC